jgi:uncharacterized protein (DUF2236 family)
MVRASVSLLPQVVRDKLALGPKYNLSAIDRMVVSALGAYLNRKPIPGTPPYDASLRIGLPGNFLFVSKRKRAELLAAWRRARPIVDPGAAQAAE